MPDIETPRQSVLWGIIEVLKSGIHYSFQQLPSEFKFKLAFWFAIKRSELKIFHLKRAIENKRPSSIGTTVPKTQKNIFSTHRFHNTAHWEKLQYSDYWNLLFSQLLISKASVLCTHLG
jgi:hypothetical protein